MLDLELLKRKYNINSDIKAKRIYHAYIKYNKPISRSLQSRFFFEDEFIIDNTLDPRPETEELVELILSKYHNIKNILDLGTGSGCILITLLKKYKEAIGLGIDISQKALETAKRNAKNIGVLRRAQFKQNDWLNNVFNKFDLIVSNPPYVEEIINKELQYDPEIALIGNLQTYENIISKIRNVMNKNARVIFEINELYGKSLVELCKKYRFNAQIHKDLAHKDRFISFSYED